MSNVMNHVFFNNSSKASALSGPQGPMTLTNPSVSQPGGDNDYVNWAATMTKRSGDYDLG